MKSVCWVARRRAMLGLWCWLLAGDISWGVDLWFSPNGQGDGTSNAKAALYRPEIIRKLWSVAPTKDPSVRLHFLPGEYYVEPIGPVTGRPSLWRLSILGEGKVPEDTVLKLVNNHQGGESDGGGNYASIVDLRRNEEYLDRIVVENLTLDGNWQGQSSFNHSGYLRAFKISPLSASSRTGRIRKVLIRNFGAHGPVPQRIGDVGAGVEAFPLSVYTREEGQLPEDGDAFPWVVEDCELSDFNALFAGYTTCLITVVRSREANTPDWAAQDERRRLVWFRRNQVRGLPDDPGVIGLGVAGLGTNFSSKITFSDNVVLNSAGFNTDTGEIRHLDITNNLFLDAVALGYLGTPFSGTPKMERYDVSGNSVRLRGRFAPASYRNFVWVNGAQQTVGDLDLGARSYPPAVGLAISGIANQVRFDGNWFTTWTADDFGVGVPEFRILHRIPEETQVQHYNFKIPRGPLRNLEARGNKLSRVAFDFQQLQSLEDTRMGELMEGSTPLMQWRKPLELSSGFRPTGMVGRVGLLFGNVPMRFERKGKKTKDAAEVESAVVTPVERVLSGALEVCLGIPELKSNAVLVPVRVAIQPTPQSGMLGTRVVSNRVVHLEVEKGSLHPKKLSSKTDETGVAWFRIPLSPNENGFDRYLAWTDLGQGEREKWDEYQDAWARSSYRFGFVVDVRIQDEVADAGSDLPGRLEFVRQGDLSNSLTAKVELGRGTTDGELGRDFEIKSEAGSRLRMANQGVSGELVFARGVGTNVVSIRALKTGRSGRLATVQLQPGNNYAVGPNGTGRVVVYVPN